MCGGRPLTAAELEWRTEGGKTSCGTRPQERHDVGENKNVSKIRYLLAICDQYTRVGWKDPKKEKWGCGLTFQGGECRAEVGTNLQLRCCVSFQALRKGKGLLAEGE